MNSELALASLRGLAIGDGFGERLSRPGDHPDLTARTLPDGPWLWTDDTEMACSVYAVLRRHGYVDQEALAASFAERYDTGIDRGYGPGTERLLVQLRRGSSWRELADRDGRGGSWGNGGAMRVAPLGAFFGADLPRVLLEAERSAVVTHAHLEGVAGAVAVAVAASLRAVRPRLGGAELLEGVLPFVPPGLVRDGLAKAARVMGEPAEVAASELGAGQRMSAQDTVPLALWVAASFSGSFEDALWTVVRVADDVDTVGAMVGGVLAAGEHEVPAEWGRRAEPLPGWVLG
ncbi:ADP-ribosylglycohydrolase family protein [Amycolatopsis benzoatilytica]|uniref:ADP-ribosylglycohydrolase family protein n=1 Tax=Amycolatopsis benzoatilytica TaxID=346045 RepID=UPI000364BFC9|nr:ADP-ribosylglycohydrolase family protein [Amycolatopsis benzoatilytica]